MSGTPSVSTMPAFLEAGFQFVTPVTAYTVPSIPKNRIHMEINIISGLIMVCPFTGHRKAEVEWLEHSRRCGRRASIALILGSRQSKWGIQSRSACLVWVG
jgi:hypothetical protein